jgi:predicted nucleic acid-binding protein
VALKWVLPEPDSARAAALLEKVEQLLLPDFWLAEAINVLWRQVRRTLLTPHEAKEGLGLLRSIAPLTPTGDFGLHETALEIGLLVNHSPYDTLYVAFAVAMGAKHVITADSPFARNMRAHPNPALSQIMLPLSEWRG